MLVSELPFAEQVRTLKSDQLVGEAVELFQEHQIGSVVIVDDDNKVLGIFTERDYMKKISGRKPGMDSDPIARHMTPNPKSVLLTDPVMKAAISMRLGKFRHVVIVGEDQRIEGMISVKDVLDWMMDTLTSQYESKA